MVYSKDAVSIIAEYDQVLKAAHPRYSRRIQTDKETNILTRNFMHWYNTKVFNTYPEKASNKRQWWSGSIAIARPGMDLTCDIKDSALYKCISRLGRSLQLLALLLNRHSVCCCLKQGRRPHYGEFILRRNHLI